MRSKDRATKLMMSQPDVFKDAFNVLLRRAGVTVDMEDLREKDTVLTAPLDSDETKGDWVECINDVVKEAIVRRVGGMDCVLLCLENQSEVAYDMPLRNLFTAVLQWKKCHAYLKERNRSVRKKLKRGAEFLSGMRKGEFLPPIIVMALYVGMTSWTGPTCLQDIVKTTIPELRQFMADCPTNIVSLVDLTSEETSCMKSPLRLLVKLLKTHGDKDEMMCMLREDPMFHDAPAILYRVYNELTNSNLTIPRKKEHNDMCKAFEQLIEEGREKGRKEIQAKIDKINEKIRAEREKTRAEREKTRAEREKTRVERENGIRNLIRVCRKLGQSFENICQFLMDDYHLSSRQAATYVRNCID